MLSNIEKKSNHNHEKGELLLSLLVTISIIIVMISIGIPAYSRFKPNIELSGSVTDLVADLRLAQQLCLSEQIVYGLQLSQALDRYEIISVDTATTTIKTVTLPASVELGAIAGFDDDLVRFNSYGAVSQAGDIELISENGNTKRIYVRPSGHIQSE
jgi:hypothetical protein